LDKLTTIGFHGGNNRKLGEGDRLGRFQSASRRLALHWKPSLFGELPRAADAFGGTPKAAGEDARAPPIHLIGYGSNDIVEIMKKHPGNTSKIQSIFRLPP
jgi:hypothetical protein